MLGLSAYMTILLWWAEVLPGLSTVALHLFSLLLLILSSLYWPQLVLFRQSSAVRLRDCTLFCVKHFWRVMGAGVLRLSYIVIYVCIEKEKFLTSTRENGKIICMHSSFAISLVPQF